MCAGTISGQKRASDVQELDYRQWVLLTKLGVFEGQQALFTTQLLIPNV